jgi:hypothetical protein
LPFDLGHVKILARDAFENAHLGWWPPELANQSVERRYCGIATAIEVVVFSPTNKGDACVVILCALHTSALRPVVLPLRLAFEYGLILGFGLGP